MQYGSIYVIGLIVLSLTGCFRGVLLDSTAIERSNENDIVVSTKDAHQIKFASYQYNFDSDEKGRRVLRGKGKLYRQGESRFESFEGTILADNIQRISTSEKTSMFYVSIVAAAVGVGYLLFAFALAGKL